MLFRFFFKNCIQVYVRLQHLTVNINYRLKKIKVCAYIGSVGSIGSGGRVGVHEVGGHEESRIVELVVA